MNSVFPFQQDSFEMYVEYCQHKESAHKFLSTTVVKNYFDVCEIILHKQKKVSLPLFIWSFLKKLKNHAFSGNVR